ncbi:MAG TPA: ABC transporter permease [Gemmatimonadales bacterium]|jgi:predicted permease
MIRWLRRVLPRWHTVDREIEEEVAFHLDSRAADLVMEGLPEAEARRQAEREFGDLQAARAQLAAIDRAQGDKARRGALLMDLAGDVRFGLRLLARSPGFTALLLITLALAIGANSATFTVVRSALLRGLPYLEPDRLVHLWETHAGGRSEASYPDFLDWRTERGVFAQLEGYNASDVTVARPDGGEIRLGGRVTPGFFELLGTQPILGRSFRPEEDVPDGAPVVILSYGYWMEVFGGDRGVLDSTLTLDGRPSRVIGILPPEFHFAPIGTADLWLTLGRSAERRGQRFNHWVNVVARLRDGVTPAGAAVSLNALMNRLAASYPGSNQGRAALVVPLRQQLLGDIRPVLVALFVAMGLVLAIACANIASLLLARSLGREQEIRLRSALGASRWRLTRQLLVECLILGVLGGALGAMVGHLGVRLVVTSLPEALLDHLPYLRRVSVDAAVLGYTMLLALATALGFGLGPIAHAIRADGRGLVVRRSGVTAPGALLRLRDGLIVGEIALTLVLLTGTALVGRSLAALLSLELGFEPDQVLTLRVALNGPRFEANAVRQQFMDRLLDGVRALPGVSASGAVANLPLQGGNTNTFRVEGEPEAPPASRLEATTRATAGEYFRALGIRLVEGRVFDATDDSTHRLSVLISESLARHLFPAGSAIGRELRFYAFPESTWQIAGVVGDVRTGPLDAPSPPTIYFTHRQYPAYRMSVVVRSAVEPAALSREVRRLVRELDPAVPVYQVNTLKAEIGAAPAVAARRVPLLLIGAFAGAALIVAMVGLYGVVSFNVARRSREFGIRMALGAGPEQILGTVLRYGVSLALAGLGLGLLLALGLGQLLRGMLFGIGPGDPIAYLAAGSLLALVTLLASYLPARTATRVNPTDALRAD